MEDPEYFLCGFIFEEGTLMTSAEHEQIAAEEAEEAAEVFALIDYERNGVISQAALAQALLGSALLDETGARDASAAAAAQHNCLDVDAFRACLAEAVQKANASSMLQSEAKTGSAPASIGSGLLGILEDLRKFYANGAAGPIRSSRSPNPSRSSRPTQFLPTNSSPPTLVAAQRTPATATATATATAHAPQSGTTSAWPTRPSQRTRR